MIYTTILWLIPLFAVYLILYHTKLGRRIIDFIVNGLNDF